MRAQTLALCLPFEGCDQKCPYCVSKMTWSPEPNPPRWALNLQKVRSFAERAQVTDVVITGKGEPALHLNYIRDVVIRNFGHWPIVLQTNGRHILSSPYSMLQRICNVMEGDPHTTLPHHWGGIDVLAVSIEHPQTLEEYAPIWEACEKLGLLSRITVMLTPDVVSIKPKDWIELCKKHHIRQASFREVTVPLGRVRTPESEEAAKWVRDHIEGNIHIAMWIQDLNQKLGYMSETLFRKIRTLPYGAIIKDVEGVAMTLFNYCIQDNNGEDDIRSLIFNQDGHLYTTWNSPASAIF